MRLKTKSELKCLIYLWREYELGKYENSRFSEPLEVKNSDYLLDILTINEDDYIAKINVYNSYLKLDITNIEDKKIYSFTYQEKKVNLYKNEDRGEIIISKNKIIEKDTNGNQRISNFIREDSALDIRDADIHTPEALVNILKKFSDDDRLKHTNHILDENFNYNTLIKDFERGFKEISSDLEKLSDTLYQSINDLLFSKDETIQGWSSEIIKNEIKQKNFNSHLINDLQERFKSLIVIKDEEKLDLFDRFDKIIDELDLNIEINLDYLGENPIDKFFTDTKRFEQAIKIIFKDINEHIRDNSQGIIVEADEIPIKGIDILEIKIIHINSSSSQNSNKLEETLHKNGGHFKSIYTNLISLCDWSIDTLCSDGRYKIDYLYPKIDNNKTHCTKSRR
ncbi:MAG: hypothetical protein Q9M36_03175 [Sulfurovum sp.]|nr:hypothetical protein [Sulfurovum sp.]